MKTTLEYWSPDPKERAAEIAARRENLEQQYIEPIRARIALLQNLRPEQVAIFDKLIAGVLASPRDDDELRGAITRLQEYLHRREADPRTAAKPIPQQVRDKIVGALEENGLPVTEDAILDMWAKAQK